MERILAHNAMLVTAGFDSFLANGESLGEYCVNEAEIYVKIKEQSNFVPLCKFLASAFRTDKSFLIFDEFGIWPSSEDVYLYKSLYKYYVGLEFQDHSSRRSHASSRGAYLPSAAWTIPSLYWNTFE